MVCKVGLLGGTGKLLAVKSNDVVPASGGRVKTLSLPCFNFIFLFSYFCFLFFDFLD